MSLHEHVLAVRREVEARRLTVRSRILRLLKDGPLSARHLSDRIFITLTDMQRYLRQLEKDGLVARDPIPSEWQSARYNSKFLWRLT